MKPKLAIVPITRPSIQRPKPGADSLKSCASSSQGWEGVVKDQVVALGLTGLQLLYQKATGKPIFAVKKQSVGLRQVGSRDLTQSSLRPLLDSDCFVTVNAHTGNKRGEQHVSDLLAAVVDVDRTHELPFLRREAIRAGLPEPILVDSGNHAWLAFPLKGPPKGTQQNREVLKSINRSLVEKFKHLGADPMATDTTRFWRVPGSVNSKTGRRVQWYAALNQGGALPYTTLDQLQAALGLEQKSFPNFGNFRQIFEKPSHPQRDARVKGYRERYRRELDALRQLEELRRGPRESTRRNWLYVIVSIMRKTHVAQEIVEREALAFAQRCVPPLPDAVALKIARQKEIARFHMRRTTIFQLLKVTVCEREQIRYWRPKGKKRPPPEELARQAKERRAWITKAVSFLTYIPSLGEMRHILSTNYEIRTTRKTLHQDYLILGYRGTPEVLPVSASTYYSSSMVLAGTGNSSEEEEEDRPRRAKRESAAPERFLP